MDIAAFICEQLEHRNLINVPGLGSFYRSRVDGYYNKDQQQFYPPSMQIDFSNEQADYDTLATLLSVEKRISQASASYFIDKFVVSLKQQAETENVALGDIGVFNTRKNELVFTPKRGGEISDAFYGLTPVRLKRNSPYKQEAEENEIPALKTPVYAMPPITATVAMPLNTEEQDIPDEGHELNRVNIWLIIALVIVMCGISLVVLYKIKPSVFDGIITPAAKPPIVKTEKVVKKLVSDSIEQTIQAQKDLGLTPKLDSATKSKILAPEIPRDTFGIVVESYKTLYGARRSLQNYTNKGIVDADIHFNLKTRYYQIVMGTFLNNDSAKTHLNYYRHRFKSPDIYIDTYPYRKQ